MPERAILVRVGGLELESRRGGKMRVNNIRTYKKEFTFHYTLLKREKIGHVGCAEFLHKETRRG